MKLSRIAGVVMTNDIVCIWSGEKSRFPVEYVYKLKNMVYRNVTGDNRFICLTHNPELIEDEDVIPVRLPDETIAGSWNMIQLFHGYDFLSDRLVYFDLDTVILGNIDDLVNSESGFYVLYDFGMKKPTFGGAVKVFNQKYRWIWDLFQKDKNDIMKKQKRSDLWYGGLITRSHTDIKWIQDEYPGQYESYKINLKRGEPHSNTRVVCFHGSPMPHEVKNKFVRENWL